MAPESLNQPPRQSSKRPRAFAQMPTQAGLGSAATASQIPAPVQLATQAVEDPFPVHDGWESLEMFDYEFQGMTDFDWAEQQLNFDWSWSDPATEPGPFSPIPALPGLARSQADDSKPAAINDGNLKKPPAQPRRHSRVVEQRPSQGVLGSVAAASHTHFLAQGAAQAEEVSLLTDQDWEFLELFLPDRPDVFDTAGRIAEALSEPSPELLNSPEFQKQQISQEIAQCVIATRAKESFAKDHHASSLFFQSVKSAASDAARFVETQAQAIQNDQVSLKLLAEVRRRCTAGKQAVEQVAANAFDSDRIIEIEKVVSDASRAGPDAIANAVTAIAETASDSVLDYPELKEVVQASAAAAAAVAATAMRRALVLDPDNMDKVARSLKVALKGKPKGQLVLDFLGKATLANKVRKEQVSQVISNCVSEARAAEALASRHPSSSAFALSLKRAASRAAQFVENESKRVSQNEVSLDQLLEAKEKCMAGKTALQLLAANAFVIDKTNQIKEELLNAVTVNKQSPAQAAAAIAVHAVGPLLENTRFPEVLSASVAASAAVAAIAIRLATRLSPQDGREIMHTTTGALSRWPEGQLVAGFLKKFARSHERHRQQIAQAISQAVLTSRQLASEALAAEISGISRVDSAAEFTQSVKRAASDVVRFVEAQARAAQNKSADALFLEEVQRKCTAGQEALRMIVSTAFNRSTVDQVNIAVSGPVETGQQSPGQAAAVIAVRASASVLKHPNLPEVVEATAAAAATVVLLAAERAILFTPSDGLGIRQTIGAALGQSPAGAAVLDFIGRAGSLNSSTRPT